MMTHDFDLGVINKTIFDFSSNNGCILEIPASMNYLYLKT